MGQKDAIKAQNAAALAQEQVRKENQALNYFNAMDNYYLRQYSDLQNKAIGDEIQQEEFKDALKVSDLQKDAQLRAFDLSEERYREQLQINQAEYNRAAGNLNRQFDSTIRGYDEQLKDQERAFGIELAQASFRQDAAQRVKDQVSARYGFQTREDALSINRARDQLTRRRAIRDAGTTRQSQFLEQDRADVESQRNEIRDLRTQQDLLRANREKSAQLEEFRAQTNLDSQLSNIAFQKEGQRIETLTRVGQSKARGQKGRSAVRALQTTRALGGINTARLTNQAFFAKQDFQATKESVALGLQAIGIEDEMAKVRETTALEQLATRSSRLTTQDTYDTAVSTAEAQADQTEESRLGEQESLLSDIALNQFQENTAEADQALNEIAFAIGVSKEQLSMNKDRLGASLVNSVASIDDQLLALDQAKYKSDYNAHAARMLPPVFAPDAKAPYDVPLPKYLKPRPGAAPAPAYQAQYVAPPSQSGLSKALMIGGAALSIAAIPFTMGASIGAASGLTTLGALGGMKIGTAAAIGTGLGAAGGVLGTASKYTYNY
tara:strand:+ start:3160 stop:4812 length:1653 start_codon:yes stop_codon:yes gene_type:complete